MTPHADLITVDPSSTRTGYALWNRGELAEAGYIGPDRVADAPLARIDAIGRELNAIVKTARPTVAVVEVPAGGPGSASRKGAKTSLITYGLAVGYLLRLLLDAGIDRVVPIAETEWTKGRPKRQRQLAIAATFPDYSTENDRKADAADAIGLGLWWVRRNPPEHRP